ncbi:MAG: nuclear transport factor 2 family protein [Mycolicibacterium neoaurum]|uniref:nuclear transport factor 2 family protein n=1 Tax=Mycolicibacterium neoaurum TaxID=1795 RepID=UPI002FF67579
MSGMADIARDMHDIKQVKYRYLRALDTKHWDDFAATLTEDIDGDYGSNPDGTGTLRFTDRDTLVEYMRTSLGPAIITEHRVDHPEIALDGPDEATGRWYLQDRVIAADFGFMLIGAAFYRDRYRRTANGWKICATGYDRTYEATMSTENLGFHLKPGPALAT